MPFLNYAHSLGVKQGLGVFRSCIRISVRPQLTKRRNYETAFCDICNVYSVLYTEQIQLWFPSTLKMEAICISETNPANYTAPYPEYVSISRDSSENSKSLNN